MKKTTSTLFIALFGVVSVSVSAHSMFIIPASFQVEAGKVLAVAVNSTDVFPESDFADTNLSTLNLHGGSEVIGVDLKENDKRMIGAVAISSPSHIFMTTSTATATLEIEAKDFNDYVSEESLDHVIAAREQSGETDKAATERYTKYAKALLLSEQTDEQFDRALGLPLEFIVEKNPYAAKVGDALPVRVLFEGQPAADLDITAFWLSANGPERQIVGRTDAEGRANITLSAAGAWNLHTIHMERSNDTGVDWESHWTTLTFEVPLAE
ncbi:MAG: DUF4198 domain-containing protein [Pseudomonadota bacterium]